MMDIDEKAAHEWNNDVRSYSKSTVLPSGAMVRMYLSIEKLLLNTKMV